MVGINLPWLSGRHARRGARGGSRRCWPSGTRSSRRRTPSATSCATPPRASIRRASRSRSSTRTCWRRRRRSLEATQAAYAAGQGDAIGLLDALRSYLQVRIERVRALAELASSEADLERAAGTLAAGGGPMTTSKSVDDPTRSPAQGRRAAWRRCRSCAGCWWWSPRWSRSARSCSFAGVRLGGGRRARRRGQLYHCPMHPSVVQDHPGECPICSMTLVPKPERQAEADRQRRRPRSASVPGWRRSI